MPTVSRHPRERHAFSLLETALVVSITAILAISAIPAMNSMSAARQAAAAEEVERRLVVARSRALAEGVPYGVAFDTTAQTLRTMMIPALGTPPTPARDVLGQSEPALALESTFPGVRLTVVSSEAGSGSQTFWFAFDGTPQSRSAGGALVGNWNENAIITVTGGVSVHVQAHSGAVTR